MSKTDSNKIQRTVRAYKRSLALDIKCGGDSLRAEIPITIEELEELREKLTIQQRTIERSVSKLHEQDVLWLDLIDQITDPEQKAKESQTYDETASDETDGYHPLIEEAETLAIRITARVERLTEKEHKLRLSVQTPMGYQYQTPAKTHESEHVASNAGQLHSENGNSNDGLNDDSRSGPIQTAGDTAAPADNFAHRLKLPKLRLPTFDGDLLKFHEFWSIFNETIHKRTDLTNIEKLSYLLPQLKGDAELTVKGYLMTDDNYDIIVKRLQERFSRSDDRFQSLLHAELKRIPQSGNAVKDKRRTMDSCERVFRQLEQAGQNLDPGKSLVFDLLAKFTPGMIKDLDRRYHVGVYSNLSEVRTAIEKSINEEELTFGFLQDLEVSKQPSGQARRQPDQRGQGFRPPTFPSANRPFQRYGPGGLRGEPGMASGGTKRSGPPTGPSIRPPSSPCYFCDKLHQNEACLSFPTAASRTQRLATVGRCHRCMKRHAWVPQCTRSIFCHHCQSDSHCTALCQRRFPEPRSNTPNRLPSTGGQGQRKGPVSGPSNSGNTASGKGSNGSNPEPTTSVNDISNFSRACTKNSLFQTALVTAVNLETLQRYRVRLCLDTLSNRTYITEQAAGWLNLSPKSSDQLFVSVFGTEKTMTMRSSSVNFGLEQTDGKVMKVDANTTRLISNAVVLPQDWPTDTARMLESWQGCLADNPFDDDKTIDILLGADYAWDVICGSKVDMRSSSVFLIPSVFGFMLGGQLSYDSNARRDNAPTMLCITESSCQFPNELGLIAQESKIQSSYPNIDEFWKLETLGIEDCPIEDEDSVALARFNQTVAKEGSRYAVRWPWKEDKRQILPTNYTTALKRFKFLTQRFSSDSKLYETYRDILRDQLNRGFIEKIPKSEIATDNLTHYLPHHPIFKPSSATTKVRIVYDASSRQRKDDVSLNECLLRGPVILPDLCHLLIRFRTYAVVIMSDIEKAFLQISIQKQDRDVTRFFWYEDEEHVDADQSNLATYRFARVPFGIICSPFLLGATINYHLEQDGTSFAKKLSKDIYVDNVISGIQSGEDPIKYYRTAKDIFARASMNLREFYSNSPVLMKSLPENDRTKDEKARVLGMIWDGMDKDTIKIVRSTKWNEQRATTKRTVLKEIASIFDPLGLFQPAIFPAKLFLQKLWSMNMAWDSKIDAEMSSEWDSIRENMHAIFDCDITRYVGTVTTDSTIVAFGDASAKGYGTAVYLRMPTSVEKSSFQTHLIFAKSRLAPVAKGGGKGRTQTVSLPRLELLAMYISTVAVDFCRNALHDPDISAYVFSDSECVLHWLNSSKDLKRFVQRRIERIRKLSNSSFRYVGTKDNPADYLTRGKTAEELIECEQWWHGPSWLSKSHQSWPRPRLPPVSSEVLREIKVSDHLQADITYTANANAGTETNPVSTLFGVPLDRFSSLQKFVRVLWLCFRFVQKKLWTKLSLDTQQKYPNLHKAFREIDVDRFNPSAHQTVLRLLVKDIQLMSFASDIDSIRKKRSTTLVKQLNLHLDEYGILRVCSRYQHADLPESAKYPVLLPKNHRFSELVVLDIHSRNHHVGVSHTLSELRRQYWIPHGRAFIKKLLNRCTICRVLKSVPTFKLPVMPPWPKERVSRSAPFQFIGLDYFGPMKVKIDESMCKMWACLFTCLSTRAVHIEPVTDCSSIEFFNCLCRFIARRGCPQQIISDNAAQFVLTKILADRAWKRTPEDDSLLSYSAQHGLHWKFIIELAPWQGGHYERLVGVVKAVLRTAVGRRVLSWSDLITLLVETEGIVNSRPITYTNVENSDNFRVLRPVDFLLYRPISALPETTTDFPLRDLGDSGKRLASVWKQRERYLQKLWSVWYEDYLASLRERTNLFHRGGRSRIDRVPRVGEVVILKEAGVPRGSWKMARIVQLVTSKDGKVRAAEVRLANGIVLRRSVSFLIPMEIEIAEMPMTESPATPDDQDFSRQPDDPAIPDNPVIIAPGHPLHLEFLHTGPIVIAGRQFFSINQCFAACFLAQHNFFVEAERLTSDPYFRDVPQKCVQFALAILRERNVEISAPWMMNRFNVLSAILYEFVRSDDPPNIFRRFVEYASEQHHQETAYIVTSGSGDERLFSIGLSRHRIVKLLLSDRDPRNRAPGHNLGGLALKYVFDVWAGNDLPPVFSVPDLLQTAQFGGFDYLKTVALVSDSIFRYAKHVEGGGIFVESGATCERIAELLRLAHVDLGQFKVIVFCVGTNDASRLGYDEQALSLVHFYDAIRSVIENHNKVVIINTGIGVRSRPDIPSYTRWFLTRIRSYIEDGAADVTGVHFCDWSDPSPKNFFIDSERNPDSYFMDPDGVHPSPHGLKRMVLEWTHISQLVGSVNIEVSNQNQKYPVGSLHDMTD